MTKIERREALATYFMYASADTIGTIVDGNFRLTAEAEEKLVDLREIGGNKNVDEKLKNLGYDPIPLIRKILQRYADDHFDEVQDIAADDLDALNYFDYDVYKNEHEDYYLRRRELEQRYYRKRRKALKKSLIRSGIYTDEVRDLFIAIV